MIKQHLSWIHLTRLFLVVVAAGVLVVACGGQPDVAPATLAESAVNNSNLSDLLAGVPDEARRATRVGDPRPPAYWAVWNSCAPDNRAAEAIANGGPAAGWFLVDDLLANPSIQLGDYPVTSCEEGVVLLQVATAADGNIVSQLAGQLLAAELNLNIGAESCPIVEETAVGGHIVLSAVGFDGQAPTAAELNDELATAVPRLIQLLTAYNSGDLCR